jgi:hypothetical protein
MSLYEGLTCDNCGDGEVVVIYGLGEDEPVPDDRVSEVVGSGDEFIAYCEGCDEEERERDRLATASPAMTERVLRVEARR